jgi:hypothetical protein
METLQFLPSVLLLNSMLLSPILNRCQWNATFGSLFTAVELQNLSYCSLRYKHKQAFIQSATRCPILTKSGIPGQIFAKAPNTKIHENPSDVSSAKT